ncbi:hypothetical protein RRG08_036951 [Elysia crispata]|uniref:C-type lectin domain-containing protein n=1 Tax=Elysia crispata TaxID=231223 RepID=A0AAE0YYB3_9GAST|nr:hypothetical protein RRG08_036951 [Elysia crispata]
MKSFLVLPGFISRGCLCGKPSVLVVREPPSLSSGYVGISLFWLYGNLYLLVMWESRSSYCMGTSIFWLCGNLALLVVWEPLSSGYVGISLFWLYGNLYLLVMWESRSSGCMGTSIFWLCGNLALLVVWEPLSSGYVGISLFWLYGNLYLLVMWESRSSGCMGTSLFWLCGNLALLVVWEPLSSGYVGISLFLLYGNLYLLVMWESRSSGCMGTSIFWLCGNLALLIVWEPLSSGYVGISLFLLYGNLYLLVMWESRSSGCMGTSIFWLCVNLALLVVWQPLSSGYVGISLFLLYGNLYLLVMWESRSSGCMGTSLFYLCGNPSFLVMWYSSLLVVWEPLSSGCVEPLSSECGNLSLLVVWQYITSGCVEPFSSGYVGTLYSGCVVTSLLWLCGNPSILVMWKPLYSGYVGTLYSGCVVTSLLWLCGNPSILVMWKPLYSGYLGTPLFSLCGSVSSAEILEEPIKMMCQILLLLVCTLVTVSAVATRPCHSGWAQRGHNCYQLFKKHLFFDDGPAHYLSGRFCNDIGASLAEITSEEENEFVKAWLKRKIYTNDTVGVWIGGKKAYNKKKWEWTTSGNPLNYTDWAPHQDFQYKGCMSMSPAFNYSWVPEFCSKMKNMKYICEKHMYNLIGRCYGDSCYYLHLGTYRAKTSPNDIYDKDVDPQYLPCPRGHLVEINSREENDFILNYLDEAEDVIQTVWTGGYEDIVGRWKWAHSGATISNFTNWAQQPDSDDNGIYFGDICLGLSRADNWEWKKIECDTMLPVLCERPAGWFPKG